MANHAAKERKVSLGSVLGAVKKEKEPPTTGNGGHERGVTTTRTATTAAALALTAVRYGAPPVLLAAWH